mgnify:CR=1 FL=1
MIDPKAQLLDAALMHVPFDGWSPATFKAAIEDSQVDPTVAHAVCPRGAVDLAVADDPMARQYAVEKAVDDAQKASGRSTMGRGGMRGGVKRRKGR